MSERRLLYSEMPRRDNSSGACDSDLGLLHSVLEHGTEHGRPRCQHLRANNTSPVSDTTSGHGMNQIQSSLGCTRKANRPSQRIHPRRRQHQPDKTAGPSDALTALCARKSCPPARSVTSACTGSLASAATSRRSSCTDSLCSCTQSGRSMSDDISPGQHNEAARRRRRTPTVVVPACRCG